MDSDFDLSTVVRRQEACEAIARELRGNNDGLAPYVRLLAQIMSEKFEADADIGI